MKKIILNIIILIIICAGIIINSCTKLEDTNYTNLIASEFVPTEKDAGALFGAAYAGWRELISPNDWSAGWWLTQEMSSDEACIARKPFGWEDGGMHRRMHEHNWTVEENYIESIWLAYEGITNCNRVLFQIEGLPVDNDTKAQMKAEIKVLRASYYWILCDNTGNVPIVDKFDVPEGYMPKQNTRQEVYDFVVKEITESIPYLKEKTDKSTYARFNSKPAANTLLAKVFLNAKVYTGIPQWDKCLEACNAVIASGSYTLEPVQKNVFKAYNENSKEIIFAVPYDQVYLAGKNMQLMFYFTLTQHFQKMYNLRGEPWGGMTSIPQFISTFHPQDARLIDGWFYGQQYLDGKPLRCYYGTLELFNIINELPGIDSSQEYHAYKFNKYEIERGCLNRELINNDFVVFRYADVLMMKAECLLRKGDANAAATIVSEVRARNFKENPGLAVVNGAQLNEGSSYKYGLKNHFTNTFEGGANIEFGRFFDELGWEFAGEGWRRNNMIRFGVFHTKSWLSHSPSNINKTLFPIPLKELNKNPNLKQNPGY